MRTNYHGMREKCDLLMRRCMVDKHPLCLIVLEVDELEMVGDSVKALHRGRSLRAIAQAMLSLLRPDDHAARLIGKKFAVLLANLSLANACATGERLRSAISQSPVILPDGSALPPLTISAGVAEALPDDTWNTLISRADIALELAISAGRNHVAYT